MTTEKSSRRSTSVCKRRQMKMRTCARNWTTRAQHLLHELIATPQTLLPSERALVFLKLQDVEQQLALAAENKRLLASNIHDDREKLTALNKRLQTETDENAHLRKELDDARAAPAARADCHSANPAAERARARFSQIAGRRAAARARGGEQASIGQQHS